MNNKELEEIKKIAGLENIESDTVALPFIKVLNSSAAEAADLPAGTVVGKDNCVLAAKDVPFKFIPIYLFTRYSVWDKDTRSLVKFSFSKRGNWSDGSPITQADMGWVDNKPPRAQESMDIVVLPAADIDKPDDEKTYYMLSIAKRNKHKVKFAKDLKMLFITTATEQKVSKLYSCVYSFSTVKIIDDKKNVWYEFTNPKFEQKIESPGLMEFCDNVYAEVKDINAVSTALTVTATIEDANESVPAEVVDNTEF